jgi:hypothetical protein
MKAGVPITLEFPGVSVPKYMRLGRGPTSPALSGMLLAAYALRRLMVVTLRTSAHCRNAAPRRWLLNFTVSSR